VGGGPSARRGTALAQEGTAGNRSCVGQRMGDGGGSVHHRSAGEDPGVGGKGERKGD
jgi:hypothetical protein